MIVVRGIQIKVARVAAGLTHQQLADEANVAISTLRRLEVLPIIERTRVGTLGKIVTALENHGVTMSTDGEELSWKMSNPNQT